MSDKDITDTMEDAIATCIQLITSGWTLHRFTNHGEAFADPGHVYMLLPPEEKVRDEAP